MKWGDGKANKQLCTPRDVAESITRLQIQIDEIIEAGGVDAFTVYGATGDTSPDALWEKIEDHGTYDDESHQLVYAEQVNDGGAISVRLFTDMGGLGGDTYQVKLDVGDTADYLPGKLSGYVSPGSYDSATHFESIVSPDSGALRIYNSYAIIKTSSGDSSPDYLGAKWVDLGTFNSANHIPCLFEDTGSQMKGFVQKSDVNTQIDAYLSGITLGSLRYVALTSDVAGATKTSTQITPTVVTGKQVNWNAGTSKFDVTTTDITCYWVDPEDVPVPSGRIRIGRLVPLTSDVTKLQLVDPSCFTYEA